MDICDLNCPATSESPLSRVQLRDELRVFAEVVLQRHLADLASHLQQALRSDIQQCLRESHAPVPVFPLEVSEGDSLSKTGVGIGTRRFESGVFGRLGRHAAANPVQNGDEVTTTSLREAVLGRRSETEDTTKVTTGVPRAAGQHSSAEGPGGDGGSTLRSTVQSARFERLSSFVILLNSIFIGALTDVLAQTESQHPPVECQVIEILFLSAFLVEVALRLGAYGCDFFRMEIEGRSNPNFYWNMMDSTVILLQLAEVVAEHSTNSLDAVSRVSILRLVRLVRLFRVVRLLKVLRWVGDLRMIVYGIWRSLSIFFWAIVALVMMNFMCSVYFTDLVLTFKLNGSISSGDVDRHFGSLGTTMLSLFMAVTGGRNWGDLTDVLSDHMDFWVMGPFLLYMAFTLYAVLNTITGVFLESAMESVRDEQEFAVVCNARIVFAAADHNGNGRITWPDLERVLIHRDVRRFFEAVDIDFSEARALFTLLDESGDGSVSADEFIDGCLKVKGPAKSLDLLFLQREVSQLIEKHAKSKNRSLRFRHANSALWTASTASLTGTLAPKAS